MTSQSPVLEKRLVILERSAPLAEEIRQALKLNAELAELPEEAIGQLAIASRIQRFSRGQVIFEEGQKSSEVWIMIQGKAVLGYQTASGSASATCIAGRGDLFCCLPVLDGKSYPVTAMSEAASKVLVVPANLFREILGRFPKVFQNVLRRMCANLRAVECGHCHRVDRVPLRIMQTLVDLHAKHGAEILLTRWDVARLAGTTVETAIRVVAFMEKKNLIISSKKKIVIPDSDKLREYLRGEKVFESPVANRKVRKKTR